MNKQRRKKIEALISKLDEIMSDLNCLYEEEQEAYDNMPDGLQESERGETIGENIDGMEQASSDIEDAISILQEIVDR